MKRPLLVLFIVFNILSANLVMAFNMHDEQQENISEHVHMQDDTVLAVDIDESHCDHHCHYSSHMTGFVSDSSFLSLDGSGISYDIQNDHLYSVDSGQLLRPPQA